jgi:hypothetical protein
VRRRWILRSWTRLAFWNGLLGGAGYPARESVWLTMPFDIEDGAEV